MLELITERHFGEELGEVRDATDSRDLPLMA